MGREILIYMLAFGMVFFLGDFIHSYYIEVENEKNIMTTTNYGEMFTSGITSSNIYAVQFHPEKSHSNGMKLLKNFSEI